MFITLCAYCEQEYKKGERRDIVYKSDYKLGKFPIWFYKVPDHGKDNNVSHGMCPYHFAIEMKKLDEMEF